MGKTCFFLGHRDAGEELLPALAEAAERPVETPKGFDCTFYPPGMENVPRRLAIVRANRYMSWMSLTTKMQGIPACWQRN